MKRLLACSLLLAACGRPDDAVAGGRGAQVREPTAAATLEVTSPAFAAGAEIPTEHTCEGADVAPALAWAGAPAGTKSFALIVDDPDAPDPKAPQRTWVHWVLVAIPPTVTKLAAGAGAHPPDGAVAGTNDFGKTAWGGPCPPIGRHRYVFKVYALDATIGRAGIRKDALLEAMQGHVLARGELVGMYQKKK